MHHIEWYYHYCDLYYYVIIINSCYFVFALSIMQLCTHTNNNNYNVKIHPCFDYLI